MDDFLIAEFIVCFLIILSIHIGRYLYKSYIVFMNDENNTNRKI